MLTQYGFTSVFDIWSMWENTRRLRDRIDAGEVAGPKIRTTGEATFPMSLAGAPPPRQAAWGALGFMPLEKFQSASGADLSQAVEAAKKLLDAGADGLKLYAFSVGSALPDAVMQALVKEAHSRQKPVFAHPTTEAGLMAALRAGADVIAHPTPGSGQWSDSVLSSMKQAGVALIPTLSLYRYETRHDRVSVGDRLQETAGGQLRAWVGAGGVVLFGTDVGYMSEYDPTEEYALMANAGMTVAQILASLTTAPADRFDPTRQLGRVAPGFVADLTVLRRDPAVDVRALGAVAYTIRDGKIIYSSAR
jgi:imidazolonepropionase-like amidohydrolase